LHKVARALPWPSFIGARVPIFFNYWVFRLYKHRIPTHSKRGAPLLYYPGVAPIVLPCEIASGANKLSKFRQFHRALGEGVKGCQNMCRTGVHLITISTKEALNPSYRLHDEQQKQQQQIKWWWVGARICRN
jgi:hypothetical protein